MANDVVTQRGELPEFVDDACSPLFKAHAKDATSFAAASLAKIEQTGQILPVVAEQHNGSRRWRRASSPMPGQRSTSASSCETPPPTRLNKSSCETPPPTRLDRSGASR